MSFTSPVFLVFLVIVFLLWPLVRSRQRARWVFLTLASFVFYGWWDWRYLPLLIGTGLIDFAAALAIVRFPRWRTPLLLISMGSNLLVLSLFKYAAFLTTNLNAGLQALGMDAQLPVLRLTLPIGISFYTFQSMSYTIDVYRGHLKPTGSVWHFFAFLVMFPQLVAGPIVRAADLLPQLAEPERPWTAKRWSGLRLIAQGYFKKMVVADRLAPVVDAAFAAAVLPASAAYWWVVTTMFAIQIYCDFSGYSDIARGLAKWMGYEFPLNFHHPYHALSLREFWSRWHISLSTWFRDYVYIPLGGSRRGPWRTHVNLWTAMLLSGLWHGAAWTFLAWGAVHACCLSIERWTEWPRRLLRAPGGRALSWLIVMAQVWIAWVFFRAASLPQAFQILSIMLNPGEANLRALRGLGMAALGFLAAVVLWEASARLRRDRRWVETLVRMGILQPAWLSAALAACVYLRGPGHTFIYFQF